MPMVNLIDRPDLQVAIRDDLVDQYEVCRRCDGRPYAWACVGVDLYGRWRTYQQYGRCDCQGGVRRRS